MGPEPDPLRLFVGVSHRPPKYGCPDRVEARTVGRTPPNGTAMEDTQSLVESLITWTDACMPDPDRARRTRETAARRTRRWHAGPDQPALPDRCSTPSRRSVPSNGPPSDLRAARPAGPPDQESPGWPPVPRAEVEGRAGFVRSVRAAGRRRASANFGWTASTSPSTPDPSWTPPSVFWTGSTGLILDLRHNGGGAVSSLAVLAEFVLGPAPEHLATVHYRDQPPRQWWTTGGLTQVHLPESARVAMLIGPGTYSSGEALAYHLKSRARVRVFGVRTPGAADHVTPIRRHAERDRPDPGRDDDRPPDRHQLGGLGRRAETSPVWTMPTSSPAAWLTS